MNFVIVLSQLLFAECTENCPRIESNIINWKFIDKKYWIAEKDPGIVHEGSQNCPGNDMIEIKGKMGITRDSNPFSYDNIENLQKSTCKKWSEKKEYCLEFDQAKWEKIKKDLPRKDMHFCIDPYEWPNRDGAAPWVMTTWEESKELCELKGKRLCSEDEWTFACEGEEMLPFPNGYIRDAESCNIDKPWKAYDNRLMFPRGTMKSGIELNHLWQGYLSGSRTKCASPFNVHDMIGNVEEWTVTSISNKYRSILKGGYWSGTKAQCRSSIRTHGELHTFYQQGFRCCSDPEVK
jgi:formylglycine-generating enzyme required for sulfatase activity